MSTRSTRTTALSTSAPNSRARVSLYSNPALGGDGESTLVGEQTFEPAPGESFDFCISGELPSDPAENLQYHIAAEVTQAHGEHTEGDLTSETLVIVEPPVQDVVIEVSGLEDCNAPNAGGVCL